ncbi:MAG: hypothetical protein AB1728_05740 [Bacteroidota bacterium]
MLDVIDWNNFEFDMEGLYNYLSFGYQVFEQTPIKDVKFLRHSSILTVHETDNTDLRLEIREEPDPIDVYVGKSSSEEEAIMHLQQHVAAFEGESRERHVQKRFLLPLSGGYDSRLLATLIQDKSRIDAITYDISLSEKYSFEVVRAHEVSTRLNINWEQISLDQYWNSDYVQRNFDTFGLEMPIHASYHFELYDKINQMKGKDFIVLSGSVGDWWSGEKIPLSVPKNHLDFGSLFFNHGISISSDFIEVKTDHAIKREIFEKNAQRLKEDRLFRIVFARRGRIGLASYIFRTASLFYETYTPFYDLTVAMSQLNMPQSRRTDRVWLRDFFRRNGLDLENDAGHIKPVSDDNVLDVKTMRKTLTRNDLLDPKYFKGIVTTRRIEWINDMIMKVRFIPFPLLIVVSNLSYRIDSAAHRLSLRSIFGKGFDYIYCRAFKTREIAKAISEWSLLKPLELVQQRAFGKNQFRR